MAYNDRDTLLYRAECYRQLASGIPDAPTRAVLLDAANEYEARATGRNRIVMRPHSKAATLGIRLDLSI